MNIIRKKNINSTHALFLRKFNLTCNRSSYKYVYKPLYGFLLCIHFSEKLICNMQALIWQILYRIQCS